MDNKNYLILGGTGAMGASLSALLNCLKNTKLRQNSKTI